MIFKLKTPSRMKSFIVRNKGKHLPIIIIMTVIILILLLIIIEAKCRIQK